MKTPKQGLEKGVNDRISEDLTKDKLISIVKIPDGEELVGALMNGPIEVHKAIKTAIGSTSKVEHITRTGKKFYISTESGSEYRFDPSKSLEIPDSLKNKL